MAESKTGLIFSKIPTIMGKIDYVGKDRKNQMQGYQYRGIDDMYNVLHRHLAEEKVFCVPKVLSSVREERQTKNGGVLIYTIQTVEFTFYAEDGSSVVCVMEGEAMDSGDKSTNKASSAALKYAFMEIFCIPTEDSGKDSEEQTHEIKPKEDRQPATVHKVSTTEYTQMLSKITNAESLEELEQLKPAIAKMLPFLTDDRQEKLKNEGKRMKEAFMEIDQTHADLDGAFDEQMADDKA